MCCFNGCDTKIPTCAVDLASFAFEPRCEETGLRSFRPGPKVFGVSDQVQHKPGCAATEDSKRLEISDLGSRGIVLSV